ncbi:hypothetical protein BDV09DRAFT_189152 [Aspergillus tetrazonus]
MAICKLSLRCQPRNVSFWNEGPREQASWCRKPGTATFFSFRCRPRAGGQRQITSIRPHVLEMEELGRGKVRLFQVTWDEVFE